MNYNSPQITFGFGTIILGIYAIIILCIALAVIFIVIKMIDKKETYINLI